MIDPWMTPHPFSEFQKTKRDKLLAGGSYGSDRPPCPFADILIPGLYDIRLSQHHLEQ